MSTFNGARYVREQIVSIFRQKSVNADILIRDDGSTDGTLGILNEIIREYGNNRICVVCGNNLGFANSFWNLLCTSSDEYDFYAFCDQDDIWYNDKLTRCIDSICDIGDNGPVLCIGNCDTVDENGEIIKKNVLSSVKPDVYQAFQKSFYPGCTFVFNNRGKILAQRYDGPLYAHDWAFYCIVATFGTVLFLDNATMGYRQHAGNLIGLETRLRKLELRVRRFFRKSENIRARFAKRFLEIYESDIMDENLKKELLSLGNYRSDYKCKIHVLCSNKMRGLVFKLYILLNRV